MKESVNCGIGFEKLLAKSDLGSSHRCVGIRKCLTVCDVIWGQATGRF